jgi:hypothetical protein
MIKFWIYLHQQRFFQLFLRINLQFLKKQFHFKIDYNIKSLWFYNHERYFEVFRCQRMEVDVANNHIPRYISFLRTNIDVNWFESIPVFYQIEDDSLSLIVISIYEKKEGIKLPIRLVISLWFIRFRQSSWMIILDIFLIQFCKVDNWFQITGWGNNKIWTEKAVVISKLKCNLLKF